MAKKDLSKLFKELANRTDDGKRFYYDVIVGNEYQMDLSKKYNIIVDVGANLGDFCYLMYNNANIFYAIEANKENYEDMKSYIKKYKLDKIKPFHYAIAGKNGKRELYRQGGSGGFSISNINMDIAEVVKAKTLKTFFTENNIEFCDLLKTDVEDAELEIFNARDFKHIANKIGSMVGEIHTVPQNTLKKYGFSYEEFERNYRAIKNE